MRSEAALLAVMLCSITLDARGHEFWIEPSTNRPAPGEAVALELYVGDGFPGEPLPRDPGHIQRFDLYRPDGAVSIEGRAGARPAGLVRVLGPGAYVAVYRSHGTPIELEADKFESYLESDGLEHVSETRATRGESGAPGREIFSRCAKTLLRVGEGLADRFHEPVGLPLELVPEFDPLSLRPGQDLAIRALFDGKPIPGLLLQLFHKGAAGPQGRTRTGPDGRAVLTPSALGVWMISGVHMREARPGLDADWESVWTSLTFSIEPGVR